MEPAYMPISRRRIKRMCYIGTVEFHAAVKKNEVMAFAGQWMEPEGHYAN